MLLPPYSSRYGCIRSIFSQVTPEWPYVFCTNKRLNSNADKKRHIPTWITAHDRIILAICEHIGAEEAIGVGGGEGAVLFYTGAIPSIERTNTPFVPEYD